MPETWSAPLVNRSAALYKAQRLVDKANSASARHPRRLQSPCSLASCVMSQGGGSSGSSSGGSTARSATAAAAAAAAALAVALTAYGFHVRRRRSAGGRSTTSAAGGGSAAYETAKAVDEYLQMHFASADDIFPYADAPRVRPPLPERASAQHCAVMHCGFGHAMRAHSAPRCVPVRGPAPWCTVALARQCARAAPRAPRLRTGSRTASLSHADWPRSARSASR